MLLKELVMYWFNLDYILEIVILLGSPEHLNHSVEYYHGPANNYF